MNIQNNNKKEHVLVVGSGLVGICTAYFLQTKGFHVTLAEKGEYVSSGTSYGNAGTLTPFHSAPRARPAFLKSLFNSLTPAFLKPAPSNDVNSSSQASATSSFKVKWSSDLVRWGISFMACCTQSRFESGTRDLHHMAQQSQMLTLQLIDTYKMNVNIVKGVLYAYENQNELEKGQQFASYMRQFGVKTNLMQADDIIQMEPALKHAKSLVGGIWAPNDYSADAFAFSHQLAQVCQDQGVNIMCNTEIKSMNIDEVSGRVTSVTTQKGQPIYVDHLVLCNGPWISQFLRRNNIHAYIPIVPCKGHSITFMSNENVTESERLKHGLSLASLNAYLVPFGDRIRMTHGNDFVGEDWAVDPDERQFLYQTAQRIIPHLSSHLFSNSLSTSPSPSISTASVTPSVTAIVGPCSIEESLHPSPVIEWSGLRPMSPDGLPIIGQIPTYSNLYVNVGHGTLGWTTAAQSGLICAEILEAARDKAPSQSQHAPFSPLRFYNPVTSAWYKAKAVNARWFS